uniref:(northern house mosquito) hypothetical protein n=1 Tax=Culex pipiens TaxID=7175 RepID=A0A8D8I3I2_CULPI
MSCNPLSVTPAFFDTVSRKMTSFKSGGSSGLAGFSVSMSFRREVRCVFFLTFRTPSLPGGSLPAFSPPPTSLTPLGARRTLCTFTSSGDGGGWKAEGSSPLGFFSGEDSSGWGSCSVVGTRGECSSWW